MAPATLALSPVTGEPFRRLECRAPVRLEALALDRSSGELRPIREVMARCGSWTCPGCGRRLRSLHLKLIRAGIEHHAAHGRFARFVTLTFPTDTGALAAEAEDVANVTALVARYVQELRRTHAPRLEYYAVKERTKRGRLHVHLVTTGPYLRKCRRPRGAATHDADGRYIDNCRRPRGCQTRLARWRSGDLDGRRPKPCAQAIAHRIGLGWIDVRKINGAGEAAAYVAKYLAKQVGATWPRHARRATYSRGRLYCDDHPDSNGAKCCPQARRHTFYAPTTIGRLNRTAADLAYARGVGLGVIDPDARDELAAADLWHYVPGPPRAPPDPIPSSQLTEAELVARINRRLEAWIDAALEAGVIDRLEPRVPADVAQAAARGPQLPDPAAIG